MNIYTIENMIEDKLPGKLEKPKINIPENKIPNEFNKPDDVIKNEPTPPNSNQPGPQGEMGPKGDRGSDGSSTTRVFSNYVWKWPNISFNTTPHTRPHNRIVYRDTQVIEKETSNPLIYLIIGIGITILLVLMLRR